MGDVSDNVNREPGRSEIRSYILRTHAAFIGRKLIFSEAEKGVPVIFGRNPATEDLKYAKAKNPYEVHMKLLDEAGKQMKPVVPRRGLAITYTPKGYRIANLTDRNLTYEINPNLKKVLSPKVPVMIPVSEMRNFKMEIADGLLLRTQAVGGGTGRPDRVETLLFERGSI